MRIISGKFRGLQLRAPGSLPVRPTTDFAKTGLFNILSNRFDLDECDVLDLYAGTGSLSLEFVSRGIKSCIAVDKDPGCIRYMKSVNTQLETSGTLQVLQADAIRYLKNCLNRFHIIVADPPYAITPAEELTEIIFSRDLLLPGGVFILEHASERSFANHPQFHEARKYGQVSFTFFRDVTIA